MDPIEFRLRNLDDERLATVLRAAAERFGWLAGAGAGQGIALGFEKGGRVATVAGVDNVDGNLRVTRLVTAYECGAVVNPQTVTNQIEGAAVGNVMRLVVSELGGKANTQLRAEQLGQQMDGVDPKALSQVIKQLEADGLAFEGAEASFELLLKRHKAGYERPFSLCDFTVLVEQRGGAELLAEATVKVEVDGEVLHTASDGNGPVNALDSALRKALGAFYPELDAVHLVDYKVRILDSEEA